MGKIFVLALSIAALGISPAGAQQSVRGRTANPHGDLKIACENCHTTTAWTPIRKQTEFDHNRQTSFKLLGLHTDVACQSCHVSLVFSEAPTRCADCHADLHRRQFGADCEKCHTIRGWDVAISAIQQHNNRFPLLGAHAAATCDQCHFGAATGIYNGLSTECVSCHIKDYQQANNPNHVTGKLPTTCADCHSVNMWNGARFNHTQFTSFPLIGMHAQVQCAQCHTNNNFALTATACINCHLADFNNTTNPSHRAAGYPVDCTLCHGSSVLDWTSISNFNHATTGFALTGAHTSTACAQCHSNNNFGLTSGTCVNCHLTDFNNTANPPHKAGGFALDCSLCHTTTDWNGATFNHATTGFTLVGVHGTQQCAACHVNNNFSLTSTACMNCHATDFNNTTNPPHQAAGFPQDCTLCHGTSITNWTTGTFDHSTTGFTLVGAHATQQCAGCHVNSNFGLTSTSCINCHLTDFNTANNPPHQSAGFPQDCTLCHGTSIVNWTSAPSFNHTTTGFALTGGHTNLLCSQCHSSNNFSLTTTACVTCHLNDFKNTDNPNHVAAGFPQTCDTCHTTAPGWGGATFNHNSTGFALTGGHTTLQCQQCHTSAFGSYNIANGACWNCHQTDYKNTNNPNHVAGNLPQTCDTCHTTAPGWGGATFNHATTGFALTGGHTTLQCNLCHTPSFGNYNIANGACWNCHQTDYKNANNPSHAAAGFPQTCDTCHTTVVGWGGANFNHATTGFALTNAHTTLQCNQCHTPKFGNYSIQSGDCANCHMTDYNNTTNPAHKAANFPTACDGCHTTVAGWGGASFNHATTGFTLTGAHTTVQCAQCHTAQFGNYNIASGACWNCHQTDYKNTNNPSHVAAGFPQTCDTCHTTATGWGGANFNHATTGFTLTGAHTTLQCLQCHTAQFGNYNIANGACWNCHQTDYKNTNNPSHVAANFPQTCDTCHTTAAGWGGATFNHASTGFTLTGAHTSLQCNLCHTPAFGNYSIANGACWNCHQTDYKNTNNPSHVAAGFPQTCDSCHTTAAGWGGATFNHASTGFTLTGAHTTLQCTQCHTAQFGNYNITSGACWNCHQTDYKNTNNPGHVAANFPQTCDSCHTTAPGWGGATFNHASTGFTLTGAHTSLQCNQCHTPAFGNYSIANGACWNCHQTDYNNTNNPSHVAAAFPQTCDTCHTTAAGWGGATFNHASTGFTLTGAHTSLQCLQCHTPAFGNYNITSGACWNCHQTDYKNTNNPSHVAANFPQTCDTCHTTVAGWGGATFNHASTGFALTNAHTSLQCNQCHTPAFGNYSIANGACWNCHQTDYNNTNNPSHVAANFPQTCDTCHTTVAGWGGATFNHASTGFTLTNAHTTLQCTQCHNAQFGNYNITSGACWNCHQTDYNNTNNPPHKAAGFPMTCDTCHTTVAGWGGATFNHATTGFALVGVHGTQQCAACHVSGNYSLTSGACWNCHQTDYNGTTNPPHLAAGFPQDCTICHGTTIVNWTSATFNHTSTGFALVGAHPNLQCAQCHVSNNYSLTAANTTCWSCHQTDYNGAMNPPHAASSFPQDCTGCHGAAPLDWTTGTFNHASTGFALTNAHTTLACTACHNATFGNYNITSAACWNCHQTDYNGTTNPSHKAAGFPQDCSGCHTTVAGWGGATFSHPTTPWTLTGYHATTLLATYQCSSCHVNNNFTLTYTGCYACHQADYAGTTSPPHAAAGFPQDCSTCHTTTDWTGATFSHPTTPLQLTGYHATMLTANPPQCNLCHVGNNYSLNSAVCINCHQTDYNNTTNPNHAASGFATTCDSCHSFTDWTGAKFTAHDSSYFPIYSGHHNGVWTACSDCHTNAKDYSVYTCIACHQHSNQTQVDSAHTGIKGYAYTPTSCYTCHPKGTS